MTRFQYFLVSIIPDPIRNEQINIGIIGSFEDKIEYRFLNNPQKIKAIAPSFNVYDKQKIGDGIIRLIKTMPNDQIIELMPTLSDEFLYIYPVNYGWVDNYDNFLLEVEHLYKRLVKPIAKRITRFKTTKLKTDVKNQFRRKNYIGEDIKQRKIVLNYPIDEAEDLIADFAYENGTLNIIETLDFRVSAQGIKNRIKDSAFASVKIDKVKKEINKNAKGKLLYFPPINDSASIVPHQSMLSDYYDAIFNYADKNERNNFFEIIEKDLSSGGLLF